MRKKIVAGNWKMYKTFKECESFGDEMVGQLSVEDLDNKSMVIFPPFISLELLAQKFSAVNGVSIGAQNCHFENEGAFTGEISCDMIASTGAQYVLAGHSERREYFGETGELILKKIKSALSTGLQVIYCCGENLVQRKEGIHLGVIENQIHEVVNSLTMDELQNITIAYEPIWAIGTGETASAIQAQEIHAHIRQVINDHFGSNAGNQISILYGGSVKPSNAADLFSQPDIDGGLVGGASLKVADFLAIIRSMA